MFPLITRTEWFFKLHARSNDMVGKVDHHHVGHLLEGGPIGLDDRFEPRSTLGWGEQYASSTKESQARI
jgi:hypothetical protein